MTELPEEYVDSAWLKFLESRTTPEGRRYYGKHYRNVARRSNLSQSFENWLFTEGAIVRRSYKHCHLEFSFDEQATLFALKWAL